MATIRKISGDSKFQLGAQFIPINVAMKFVEKDSSFAVAAAVITTLLVTFATTFLIPSFVQSFVVEKQERALELMRIMGLKMSMYWASFYVFNVLQSFAVYLIMYVVALALRIPPMRGSYAPTGDSRPVEAFFLLFSWLHASIGLSALLCSLFSKGRNAVIITYMLIIVTVIGGSFLCALDKIPRGALIYTPLAFMWGVRELCLGRTASFEIMMLIVVGTLMMGLGMLLTELSTESSALRRQGKKKKSAFFPTILLPIAIFFCVAFFFFSIFVQFPCMFRWIFRSFSRKKRVDIVRSDNFSSAASMESADVLAERGNVSSRMSSLNLAIDDLSLVYPDGKRAVDHLTFGIDFFFFFF